MRTLLQLGAAGALFVMLASLALVTKRGGWDNTSAATRSEARRLRPVAIVFGSIALACLIGWGLTL